MILALGMAVTAGCGEPRPSDAETKAAGFGEVRHDEKPVRARFPELGDPERVAWVASPLGVTDSRVPGPTDLRMSGVVRLSAAAAGSLRSAFVWQPAKAGPDVLADLAAQVPGEASWLTTLIYEPGEEGSGRFHADFDRRVVVFDAVNPPHTTP